jgi:hypothetical protein
MEGPVNRVNISLDEDSRPNWANVPRALMLTELHHSLILPFRPPLLTEFAPNGSVAGYLLDGQRSIIPAIG